jgi:hypothetical protein
VVGVEVGEEDLVQEVVRDHVGGQVGGGPRAHVEQELVAIAELDEPAGGGLAVPGGRHAGAACAEPDLVHGQLFGPGVVDVAVRRRACGGLHLAPGPEHYEQKTGDRDACEEYDGAILAHHQFSPPVVANSERLEPPAGRPLLHPLEPGSPVLQLPHLKNGMSPAGTAGITMKRTSYVLPIVSGRTVLP